MSAQTWKGPGLTARDNFPVSPSVPPTLTAICFQTAWDGGGSGCVSLTGLPRVTGYNILIDILKLQRERDALRCRHPLITELRNLFCVVAASDPDCCAEMQ